MKYDWGWLDDYQSPAPPEAQDAPDPITVEDCGRMMRYAIEMIRSGYPGEVSLELERFVGWIETERGL